ncbi:heat shock protein DnaJ [Perkinsela sp. CCAP 1560/4]|nr:heat shock protein DnaJ [Perkinsela sp. CCAP 1560/4]KNH08253.1 heat shock protein DnaJ [Perkinsela sp. CCAP 1560/4]|eukprot:KNH07165.1 heat shock protein DnaJ [Perkinsela sp. CCAP 1560/4]
MVKLFFYYRKFLYDSFKLPMEENQNSSYLNFLEPDRQNEQIEVDKQLELCFKEEQTPNNRLTPNRCDRSDKYTGICQDFLDFHSGNETVSTISSIPELSHSLLETFSGKRTSETMDNSMESLLRNREIDSVDRAELSDQFLSVLDPRELLGVEAQADLEEIRSAYKRKLLKMHPDKNPNMSMKEAEMFRRMTEAYNKLTKDTE